MNKDNLLRISSALGGTLGVAYLLNHQTLLGILFLIGGVFWATKVGKAEPNKNKSFSYFCLFASVINLLSIPVFLILHEYVHVPYAVLNTLYGFCCYKLTRQV